MAMEPTQAIEQAIEPTAAEPTTTQSRRAKLTASLKANRPQRPAKAQRPEKAPRPPKPPRPAKPPRAPRAPRAPRPNAAAKPRAAIRPPGLPPLPAPAALNRLLDPVRTPLTVGEILQVIATLAALVPFICAAELAGILLASGPTDAGAAWIVVWIAIAALLVRAAFLGLAGSITQQAATDLTLRLRRRLTARLGLLPLGWLRGPRKSDVDTVLRQDIPAIQRFAARGVLDLTSAVITPLAAIVYLMIVDWRLTLITLLPIPIFVALRMITQRAYKEETGSYTAARSRVTVEIIDFVRAVPTMKQFPRAAQSGAELTRAAEDFARTVGTWVGPMLRLATAGTAIISAPTTLLIVLGAGTWFTSAGWIEPVDVVPFVLIGAGLASPLLSVDRRLTGLRDVAHAAERITGLLETPTLPSPATPVTPEGQRVEFSDVNLTGVDGEQSLTDIQFTLHPGTVTALVGPTGAGKENVGELLRRSWDVTSGAIKVGGIDIRQIDPEQLTRLVYVVPARPDLLRATVWENLAVARSDATDDQILAASQAAGLHARVNARSGGYETVIGSTDELSTGDRQRISLARAFLADPPILVLDEALIYAEPESEASIQDTVSRLIARRSVLLIAHRLSSVSAADQILVIKDGRTVERGQHARLLDAGGLYTRMWATQERAVHRSYAPQAPRSRPEPNGGFGFATTIGRDADDSPEVTP